MPISLAELRASRCQRGRQGRLEWQGAQEAECNREPRASPCQFHPVQPRRAHGRDIGRYQSRGCRLISTGRSAKLQWQLHLRGQAPKGAFRQQSTDVGSFSANAWDLQDMHAGNVWEWFLDWVIEDQNLRLVRGSSC